MTIKELHNRLEDAFDVVGMIDKKTYLNALEKADKQLPTLPYETICVVALAYPKRIIKHTKTHLVPSFYTFGTDYHLVLKNRMKTILDRFEVNYTFGVDNHPYDERLAATLAGIGFFGKNQLIINKTYGSYMFLGIINIDLKLEKDIILTVDDDCGDCTICLSACPTQAITASGYDVSKCISFYNQSKRELTSFEMDKNYCLFGCDICQMVCPKNIKKGTVIHPEFELSGKEMVSIMSLFSDSEKTFKAQYENMAYLWKGKTMLMRNALLILNKQKNTLYNDLIESSIHKYTMPWYQNTAIKVLNNLKKEE